LIRLPTRVARKVALIQRAALALVLIEFTNALIES
jgi:hypothetical protein